MKPPSSSVFHSMSNPTIMRCCGGVPRISSRNLAATAASHVTVIWRILPLNETPRSLEFGGPAGVARKRFFSGDGGQTPHDMLRVLCGAGVQLFLSQTPPMFGVEACGSSHQYVVYVISGAGVETLSSQSPPASLLASSLAGHAEAGDCG